MELTELMTTQDVCDYLSVTRRTVYSYVKEGKLKPKNLGGPQSGRPTYRFAREDVVRFASGAVVKAEEPAEDYLN